MKILQTVEGKAFVSYLADFFEKLNTSNRQLQGKFETIGGSKTKMFRFIAVISPILRVTKLRSVRYCCNCHLGII